MIPSNITLEHVLAAIATIDPASIPYSRLSTDYFVDHEGKRLPPKWVIGKANEIANGVDLGPKEVPSLAARELLLRLGVRVVDRQGRPVSVAAPDAEPSRKAVDVAASIERMFPDPDHRRTIASLIADTIRRAHALNPRSWVLSTPKPNQVGLTIGRLWSVWLYSGHVSVVLSDGALDGDDKAAIEALTEIKQTDFKTMPGMCKHYSGAGPAGADTALPAVLPRRHRASRGRGSADARCICQQRGGSSLLRRCSR